MCFRGTHRAIGSENVGTWYMMMCSSCGHMRARTHMWVAARKYYSFSYLSNRFNTTLETHWDRQKRIKTREKHVLSDLITFRCDRRHNNSLKVVPSRASRADFEDFTTISHWFFPTQSIKTVRMAFKPMHWSVSLLKIITWWLRKDVMMMALHIGHI